jgi:hypothetical protein
MSQYVSEKLIAMAVPRGSPDAPKPAAPPKAIREEAYG